MFFRPFPKFFGTLYIVGFVHCPGELHGSVEDHRDFYPVEARSALMKDALIAQLPQRARVLSPPPPSPPSEPAMVSSKAALISSSKGRSTSDMQYTQCSDL